MNRFSFCLISMALLYFSSCSDQKVETTVSSSSDTTSQEKSAQSQLNDLKRLLDKEGVAGWAPADFGQEVSLAAAEACIGNFDKEIKKLGFNARDGKPPAGAVRLTKHYTASVSFMGRGLLEWMTSLSRYAGPGGIDSIGVSVQFGHMDQRYVDYLNKIEEDRGSSTRHDAKKDRFTVFLVAVNTKGEIIRDTPSKPTPPPAYNVGGLKP